MTSRSARMVIANITVSLDGRTTGTGGDYEMGWIVPHAVTDGARDGLGRLTHATTVLLGRKNYEGFGSYWPAVAHDEHADSRDRNFAQWLDRVEKVVFSSSLLEAPWSNARVVSDDAAAVVRDLRRQGSGEIVVLASQSIIRALLEADEVDRLSLNLAQRSSGAAPDCSRTACPLLPGLYTTRTPATAEPSGSTTTENAPMPSSSNSWIATRQFEVHQGIRNRQHRTRQTAWSASIPAMRAGCFR